MSASANARPQPAGGPHSHASRRLLIFQETRNPQNVAETVYLPVNKLGLPICGDGPEMPSILELPLRVLRVFTDIFNQPKYKGWYVLISFYFSLFFRSFFYIWCFDTMCAWMWNHMLIYIVAGPSSLQVPTVIFRKKGNFMRWCWSRRKIRCMHRMRLIWGHLDLDLGIGLCVLCFFSCLMCGILVECWFSLYIFFIMLLLACLTCCGVSIYSLGQSGWSRCIHVFTR